MAMSDLKWDCSITCRFFSNTSATFHLASNIHSNRENDKSLIVTCAGCVSDADWEWRLVTVCSIGAAACFLRAAVQW